MPNIKHSIQEYCKKINSRISVIDIISLLITTVGLLIFLLYLDFSQKSRIKEVIYQEGESEIVSAKDVARLPFGSVSGKTYTFSWCSGSSRISEKNRIVFSSE
jgi:hypothetical protein